jgi:opacity protein-like surface antigen
MKKILFIFFVLLTSGAYAQNSNSSKPFFNGSYVGVDVGKAKSRDYGYEPLPINDWIGINDNKLNGIIYGFHLGYNFSLTKDFYFSPVLEYKKGQDLTSDWNAQTLNGETIGDCNLCMNTRLNHSASLLGKVGYLLDEKNSINIAGGWTDVNLTRGQKDGDNNNFTVYVTDKLHSIPTYGVGYERIYDDKFSFVVDYRYLKSPTRKSSTNYRGFEEFYSYRQETITAGINYRF